MADFVNLVTNAEIGLSRGEVKQRECGHLDICHCISNIENETFFLTCQHPSAWVKHVDSWKRLAERGGGNFFNFANGVLGTSVHLSSLAQINPYTICLGESSFTAKDWSSGVYLDPHYSKDYMKGKVAAKGWCLLQFPLKIKCALCMSYQIYSTKTDSIIYRYVFLQGYK